MSNNPATIENYPVSDRLWRVVHGISFAIGGTTFIAGTLVLFNTTSTAAAEWSAILYVIGSFGFLNVDVAEYWTFISDPRLRFNIALSVIGSAFYVLGSSGFIPEIYADNSTIGPWGFIIGSAFIAGSQLWKCVRIVREDAADRATTGSRKGLSASSVRALGVEANAGLGGLMFLIGTTIYVAGEPVGVGAYYHTILVIWTAGAIFFTLGAAFLNYRHFVVHPAE